MRPDHPTLLQESSALTRTVRRPCTRLRTRTASPISKRTTGKPLDTPTTHLAAGAGGAGRLPRRRPSATPALNALGAGRREGERS